MARLLCSLTVTAVCLLSFLLTDVFARGSGSRGGGGAQ